MARGGDGGFGARFSRTGASRVSDLVGVLFQDGFSIFSFGIDHDPGVVFLAVSGLYQGCPQATGFNDGIDEGTAIQGCLLGAVEGLDDFWVGSGKPGRDLDISRLGEGFGDCFGLGALGLPFWRKPQGQGPGTSLGHYAQ